MHIVAKREDHEHAERRRDQQPLGTSTKRLSAFSPARNDLHRNGEYDSKHDHDHAEGFIWDPRHKGKLGGFPVSAAERKEIVCLHARIIVSARGIQKPSDDPEKALIAPERKRNGEDHEKRRRNAAGRAQSILFFPDGKEILRRKHGTIDKRLPLCHNSKAVDRSGGNAASLEKFGKAQKEKQR